MSITDFAARLAHIPIPWWVARAASWLLAGYATVTGFDYIHPPHQASRALTMVERLATLHTWGIWFLIAGGVLALGLTIGRHAVVWLGHVMCAVLYAGFAGATIQAVVDYQNSAQVQQGGYLWRAAYVAVMVFLAHFALCVLRGPIPKRGDE